MSGVHQSYPTTRLLLVRHGETEANVAGRMQGRGNDPLTERGHHQVRAIAARLKREAHMIDAIYTSSLLRARLTAEVIGAELDLIPRPREGLQEFHLGDLEGASSKELSAAAPRTPDERYPGGESPREFVERIMGTLHGLVAAHSGSAIVAVSHGGVISTALSFWARGHGGAWRDYTPNNCALSIIEFRAGPELVSINDCVHL